MKQAGTEEVMLMILAGALVVQLFFFLYFFVRIVFHKNQKQETTQLPPVSVIISARSEAKNLMHLLPYILEQDYPEFEVVVINDRSWDDTKDILDAFRHKYAHLHVVTIQETERQHFYGKKMGVTLGIKGAKYEHLIFTDADCKPASKNWIRLMAANFSEKKKIILGYSPYQRKKGFLNKLIRFDTLQIALQYLSFAKAGIPYMGVGRNMGYEKKIFFDKGGFKTHYHITSGDDDLFINENATRSNCIIEVDPQAHMISIPKNTFMEWFRQKKRHLTTAPVYRFKHKFLLTLFPLSHVIFLTALVICLVLNKYLLISLTFLGFRLLLQILTFTGARKWLGNGDIIFWAPLLELCLIFLIPVIFISNTFVKPHKWN